MYIACINAFWQHSSASISGDKVLLICLKPSLSSDNTPHSNKMRSLSFAERRYTGLFLSLAPSSLVMLQVAPNIFSIMLAANFSVARFSDESEKPNPLKVISMLPIVRIKQLKKTVLQHGDKFLLLLSNSAFTVCVNVISYNIPLNHI